jgi:hypothetical protein
MIQDSSTLALLWTLSDPSLISSGSGHKCQLATGDKPL